MEGHALAIAQDEEAPLLGHAPRQPAKEASPATITKLIGRVKLLTLQLLPLEVEPSDLTGPQSTILTRDVVEAYKKAAGDFEETIIYCLLEARRAFLADALSDPADYDENQGRKLACEVLARKALASFPSERQPTVVSTRYSHIESDGDESLPTSALESAVDQHCPIFLSSDSAQKCVFGLWDGNLVQSRDDKGRIGYDLYENAHKHSFVDHLDPDRLAVPRYQTWLKVFLWLLFLVAYTVAIQTPDREFGVEDVILYVQLAGYLLEDITRIVKVGSLVAVNFWTTVNLSIWTLLIVALSYRLADLHVADEKLALQYRRLSFHILSCAAPLIWMKLLTVFDLFTYFGTLQVVVFRMLRESAIFFTLLALLAVGFAQALLGLDASDDTPRDATESVIRSLVEGLLGSPNFDLYARDGNLAFPFGMVLYILWCFLTLVILLNVLVALFGSAYQQVTDEAVSQYMAFFAGKVVASVRAPDQFVYVAPFNLIEIFLLPWEYYLSREVYAKINRVVLTLLFAPTLGIIAYWETRVDAHRPKRKNGSLDYEEEEQLEEDPEADEKDEGAISVVKFKDLIKAFPDMQASDASVIIEELGKLKKQLGDVERELTEFKVKKEEPSSDA